MTPKTYLEELRISAGEQTQDKEPLMKALIRSLKPVDALLVALKQMSSFLPRLEKNNPQITWPREWIGLAERFKPIDYEAKSFGFFDDEVSDVTSIAFIKALGILDGAFSAYYDNREDTSKELAASAIANIISAKLLQYWIVNFPESWEVYQQTKYEGVVDKKGFEPLQEYRASPQRHRYEQELWLALADEIEVISSNNSQQC